MNDFPTEYLGDGVYVGIERGMFKLMTSSHHAPTNTVFLEPQIYDKLANYVERAEDFYRAKLGREEPPIKGPPK